MAKRNAHFGPTLANAHLAASRLVEHARRSRLGVEGVCNPRERRRDIGWSRVGADEPMYVSRLFDLRRQQRLTGDSSDEETGQSCGFPGGVEGFGRNAG